MRQQLRIVAWSAAAWLAVAPASAGTLDFWETTRGAEDVTALFPAGVSQQAHIVFNADSAEGGGLWDGATGIKIEPTGSMVFTGFNCELQPCAANGDYQFTPGGPGTGRLLLDDGDSYGETHGIHAIGTITFDGPQSPASMPLVYCSYTGLDDFQEHTCSPFVLVQVPEPARGAALAAGAALAFGLWRWRARGTPVREE